MAVTEFRKNYHIKPPGVIEGALELITELAETLEGSVGITAFYEAVIKTRSLSSMPIPARLVQDIDQAKGVLINLNWRWVGMVQMVTLGITNDGVVILANDQRTEPIGSISDPAIKSVIWEALNPRAIPSP